MAAKRSASTELNHDNWDREYDSEEQGTFKMASQDTLKERVIKTAKRRNPISSVRNEEEGTRSVFSGFSGFQSKPADFSFLSNINKSDAPPKTNGTPSSDTPKITPTFSFGANSDTKSNLTTPTNTKSDNYYAKLKGLNESVTKWIKSKVDENPLISLQPIFRDYEKYLEEIENEEKSKQGNVTGTNSMASFTFKPPSNATESTSATTSTSSGNTTGTTGFTFGAPKTASTTAPVSFGTSNSTMQFSFGSKTSTTTVPTFSFGNPTNSSTSSNFSFGAPTPATKTNTNTTEEQKNDEDEDTPPKVEFTPVVEKDHIYTIRCKVFVKKDGKFGDRGVGNLYIKPIENSEKVQVIVRADTNLGNLLCNFVLSDSIPLQRMGNKDVMLVCIPTPETQPPPVPVLFRVKSSEEADNLLQVLEKHKK